MSLVTFLYFAYGSNMLMRRIHINNKSAVRVGIGKLRHHRLDFNYQSKRWNGAASTIVPELHSYVWGAIWEINNDDMKHLDDQEGVSSGIYKPVTVEVDMPNGKSVECRAYQLLDLPHPLKPGETLPPERQPSKIYMDTIIEGAEESGLPIDYIEILKRVTHNGYCGPVRHNCD